MLDIDKHDFCHGVGGAGVGPGTSLSNRPRRRFYSLQSADGFATANVSAGVAVFAERQPWFGEPEFNIGGDPDDRAEGYIESQLRGQYALQVGRALATAFYEQGSGQGAPIELARCSRTRKSAGGLASRGSSVTEDPVEYPVVPMGRELW